MFDEKTKGTAVEYKREGYLSKLCSGMLEGEVDGWQLQGSGVTPVEISRDPDNPSKIIGQGKLYPEAGDCFLPE
jgi:hypothetical protein